MTMATQFVAYDLTLPGAVRFTQLSDPNPKYGARPIHEKVTGSPYGSFTGVGEANPDFTFATKDLFTLVTTLVAAYASSATNGYLLAPYTGNGDVGYQKMKAGSTREPPASTVHRIHRYLNPLMYLQGISAQQNGDASARMRLCPRSSDGVTSPYTILTAQALNTTIPTVTSLYTLGPVKLNGTWITGLQGTDVSFDLGFQELFAAGQQFPSFLFAENLITKLSLTSRTAEYVDTLITAISSLVVYFRRRKADDPAALETDASAKHIKITAAGGAFISDSMTGGMASAPLTLNINGAVTLAVDQAIT